MMVPLFRCIFYVYIVMTDNFMSKYHMLFKHSSDQYCGRFEAALKLLSCAYACGTRSWITPVSS